MVKLNLNKENQFTQAGTADSRFADHSGKIQQGYQLGSLTEGLVAYYPMERGEGQVLFDGATGNHGQINGATWNGSGKVGSEGLNFDQANSEYISTDFVVSSPITFSAWIKFNTDPVSDGDAQDVFAADDGTNFFDLEYLSGGAWRWGTYDGAAPAAHRIQTSYDISTDTWYHIVGIHDGQTYRLYVDGSEIANVNDSAFTSPPDTSVFIGANNGSGTAESFFNGQIDDVRIYDRALSQPEIQALYNLTQPSGYKIEEKDVPTKQAPPSMQDDSAVARYEFNGDVTDSWGNNDGTDNGAVFVDGVYGQAGNFDGTSTYIDTTIQSLSTPFTISLWVNPDTDDGTKSSTFTNYNATSDDLFFDVDWRNNDDEFLFGLDATGVSLNALGAISPNQWHHVVGTINKDNMCLYINGKLVDTGEGSVLTIDNGSNFFIGNEPDASKRGLDGSVDDVRIYNRALTPVEVEKLYNKGAYRIKRGEI